MRIFVLIFLLTVSARAQNKLLDSLLLALNDAKEDTNKVKILNRISWAYLDVNPQKAKPYTQNLLDLSQQLNYKNGIAAAYTHFAEYYSLQGNYSEALKYRMLNLKLNEEIGDKLRIAKSYNNIGFSYYDMGEYKNALNYYFKKINTITQLNRPDYKNLTASTYNLIGLAFKDNKQYDSAFKYFSIAHNYATEIADSFLLTDVFINTALGDFENKLTDQALLNFNNALTIAQKINYTNAYAGIYVGMSDAYNQIKKFDDAIPLAQKGIHFARLTGYKVWVLYGYNSLIASYQGKKDLPSQIEYLNKRDLFKDSLANEKNTEQLQKFRTQFETSEKEKENIILAKQNQIQSLKLKQKNFLVIGLCLFLVFALGIGWLVFRQNKLKSQQKAIELEQKLLRLQMNPHFIFNSLTAIESFMYENQPAEAGKYLSDFSRLMRMVLENSREETISLEQEINTLTSFLRLQQLNLEDSFSYEINVDEALNIEKIKVPPMLFQPFVENAIKHGCADVEHGHISVSFKQKENSLIVEIADNGKGIQAEKRNKTHKSLATTITKERLSIINSKSKIIYFEIGDNSPIGTKVNFNIKIG